MDLGSIFKAPFTSESQFKVLDCTSCPNCTHVCDHHLEGSLE